MLKKTGFILILLSLLMCSRSFQNESSESNLTKAKEDSVFDSIQVAYYEFESAELEFMQQTVIDSCVSQYQCDKLEYALLKINESSDCLDFRVGSIRYSPFLHLFWRGMSRIASFEINNTLFFIDEKSIANLAFFEKAAFKRTLFLNQESIKYKGLSSDFGGGVHDVLFRATFKGCSEQKPILVDHVTLVDSGDRGVPGKSKKKINNAIKDNEG